MPIDLPELEEGETVDASVVTLQYLDRRPIPLDEGISPEARAFGEASARVFDALNSAEADDV